jgi:pilus assembly protein CpaE
MFSVYIAAQAPERDHLLSYFKDRADDAIVLGSSSDLKTALADCARDVPGVLVLDDRLFGSAAGLVSSLASTPYPIVLLANANIAAATRHALEIKAKDLISAVAWPAELLDALERVARPLYLRDRKLGRVLSIFSAKGGVGKTTLAVNIGVALAERSHEPVAIVDLDLAFGDVSAMLALTPRITMHDIVGDPTKLNQALIPFSANVHVLPAPITPDQAEDITGDVLLTIIQALREDYAFVVLDLAPGYQETNVIGLDVSDTILTLCTPDVVTLRAIGQSLTLFRDEFRYPAEKIRVVLNRTGSKTGIERPDVAAVLKIPNIFELPSAGNMPVRAANQGVPFVTQEPHHPLSRAIMALATELANEEWQKKAKPRRVNRVWRARRP